MASDAVVRMYRHLRNITTPPGETKIDLFLVSNGGDSTVPWRMVTLLRDFCSHLAVLVPHNAYSAATSMALGADEVLMHPMGMLGPIDPSIRTPFNPQHPMSGQPLPVSVEDVASYIALVKEDVGIRHEDELITAFLALVEKVHPLTLGGVKRVTAQARMLGEKLLRRRNDTMQPSAIEEVLHKLTSELFAHGHPINAREARDDIGLPFVVEAPAGLAELMWTLYEGYSRDLRLEEPFDFKQAAIVKHPLPPPPPMPGIPPSVQSATVRLDPGCYAIIESFGRSDALEAEVEVTLLRDHLGNYQTGAPQVLSERWLDRSFVPPASPRAASRPPAATPPPGL